MAQAAKSTWCTTCSPGPEYWASVTDVPCPVPGCGQTVVWWEAGHVAGYRVCLGAGPDGHLDCDTLRHRFVSAGNTQDPCLILDD